MYTLTPASSFQAPPSPPSPPSSISPTYIYEIVPLSASLLASISSDDVLRLLDPVNLNVPPTLEVRGVNKDVTCLRSFGNGGDGREGALVVTAGRDGRVVLWDFRAGGGTRAGAGKVGEIRSDQSAPILSLACSSPYSLAAGTELTNHQASVLIWDSRNFSQPTVQYVESHSDDVTELQFHPAQPQILLSGSTDGLVNIYNTTITDEEEALHQTINHGASIHHANFLSDVDIFALSHDEKFSIYKLVINTEEAVEEPSPVNYGDLRENLNGEYSVNVVKRPDGSAVLGLGKHSSESFDLIQLKNGSPWIFSPETKVTLPGAHGSEIIRSFCFLDEHKTVLTAGEDGQIKAWRSD